MEVCILVSQWLRGNDGIHHTRVRAAGGLTIYRRVLHIREFSDLYNFPMSSWTFMKVKNLCIMIWARTQICFKYKVCACLVLNRCQHIQKHTEHVNWGKFVLCFLFGPLSRTVKCFRKVWKWLQYCLWYIVQKQHTCNSLHS